MPSATLSSAKTPSLTETNRNGAGYALSLGRRGAFTV